MMSNPERRPGSFRPETAQRIAGEIIKDFRLHYNIGLKEMVVHHEYKLGDFSKLEDSRLQLRMGSQWATVSTNESPFISWADHERDEIVSRQDDQLARNRIKGMANALYLNPPNPQTKA